MDERLAAKVEDWIAADPDAGAREELRRLLDAGDGEQLRDRFSGPLRFGTAGLRGPLRAGENGMNTAVVRRAAAGLAAWLLRSPRSTALQVPRKAVDPGPGAEIDAVGGRGGPGARPVADPAANPSSNALADSVADSVADAGHPVTVVIGYDARHGSASFALDSARVFAAAGLRALVLPGPLPTPVLAFAVRHLDADAGVMVTASHNPATDNGYKVYLGGPAGDPGRGAQIVPPVDAEIEAAIRSVGPAAGLPLADNWTRLGQKIVDAYIEAAVAAVPSAAGSGGGGGGGVTVAYTPLHGVGAGVLCTAFERAGLGRPVTVDEQARPNPDFPTAAFPNPEEPGVMDLVLALGEKVGADVVLANDPDADRCAAAVGHRVLTGDEVGLLLADHVLRSRPGPVATTVVSSTALRALAAGVGVPYAQTLTGFKWIMRADPGLVFGYEEALGYAVAPGVARDKDGITAALALAGIAAEEKRAGRTLLDRLDDLAARYGVFATAQVALRVDDLTRIGALMRTLRTTPPREIGGSPVTDIVDLATPATADDGDGDHEGRAAATIAWPEAGGLPPADVLVFSLTGGRVVFRPSGTEPKLKAYLEAVAPVGPAGVAAARAQAAERLDRLRSDVTALLCAPAHESPGARAR